MNANEKTIHYELDYADAREEELKTTRRRMVRSLLYSVVSLGGPAFIYTLPSHSSLLDEWPYMLIPLASSGLGLLGVIVGLWVMVYATAQYKQDPDEYGRAQVLGLVAAMVGGVTMLFCLLTPSLR